VDTHSVVIRRLTSADAAAYRTIRLEALRQDPECFGSTFETENAQPPSWFAARLDGSTVLGAFRGADLKGIVGLLVPQGPKRAHKGMLWGMYVRPAARRAGVGRRLAEAIIALARERVELVQLSVIADNTAARRLYAGLGFVEYGVEKRALKHDGRTYDDILMAKDLTVG
jgi:ribosomal protein S18 acetylase RimI-like enzyme